MTAEQIRDELYEEQGTPFAKEGVTLQYRPFRHGAGWKWYWCLLPADQSRALAHGNADSRAAAGVAARSKARELKQVVDKIELLHADDHQS